MLTPCNSLKLDPSKLCPPSVDTENFFEALSTFKSSLLKLDNVVVANGDEIKTKRGKMETKIMPMTPGQSFIENPCLFNPYANEFYSPKDFSDLALALDQIDSETPVIFKIKFNNVTLSYSSTSDVVTIVNHDLSTDTPLDNNRYGCIYQDDTYTVCPRDFTPSHALCSMESLPSREQRRLSNKLDTLVLEGEESILSLINRVNSSVKRKLDPSDNPSTDLPAPDHEPSNCLPLIVKLDPPSPQEFVDLLVSQDEYDGFDAHLRQVARYLQILESNIAIFETDKFAFDLKLFRPVIDAAGYMKQWFSEDTIIYTLPACLLVLLCVILFCVGCIKCLRPSLARQNHEANTITLQSLALRSETRPMSAAQPPPSYQVEAV